MATTNLASTYINKINETYPTAGKDNNSQGFRDNFKNIKLSLKYSDEDIANLKTNSVKLSDPVSDFDNNIIKKAALQDVSTVIYDNTDVLASGDITLDYRNGSYQKYKISEGLHGVWVENWPGQGKAGNILLSITTGTTSATSITFYSTNVYNQGRRSLPVSLSNGNPYLFELSNDGVEGNLFVREYKEIREESTVNNVQDFPSIQTALNASANGSLYFPQGVYTINSMLTFPSNIKIFSDGIGQATLLLAEGYSADVPMVYCEGKSNIIIENIDFSGNSTLNLNRVTELLSFKLCENITFRGVRVLNTTHIGIALGDGCLNVLIEKSKFENCGRPRMSNISAPALWVDKVSGNSPAYITVNNCYFVNNNWSATYFMPNHGIFTNNVCLNNGESTIFSNEHAYDVKIENNYIDGTSRSNISASGIEIGGNRYVIKNNTILNCAADAITLTDGKHNIIDGNICFNNGKENTYFTNASGITIQCVTTATSDNIVTNNNCYDDQVTKTQKYGIVMWSSNPASFKIQRTLITNNNLYQNQLSDIKYIGDNPLNTIDSTTTVNRNILNNGSYS